VDATADLLQRRHHDTYSPIAGLDPNAAVGRAVVQVVTASSRVADRKRVSAAHDRTGLYR